MTSGYSNYMTCTHTLNYETCKTFLPCSVRHNIFAFDICYYVHLHVAQQYVRSKCNLFNHCVQYCASRYGVGYSEAIASVGIMQLCTQNIQYSSVQDVLQLCQYSTVCCTLSVSSNPITCIPKWHFTTLVQNFSPIPS